MSVERVCGIINFHCDGCDSWLDTGKHDFKQALADAKIDGWVARMNKGTGQWEHFCEVCKVENR